MALDQNNYTDSGTGAYIDIEDWQKFYSNMDAIVLGLEDYNSSFGEIDFYANSARAGIDTLDLDLNNLQTTICEPINLENEFDALDSDIKNLKDIMNLRDWRAIAAVQFAKEAVTDYDNIDPAVVEAFRQALNGNITQEVKLQLLGYAADNNLSAISLAMVYADDMLLNTLSDFLNGRVTKAGSKYGATIVKILRKAIKGDGVDDSYNTVMNKFGRTASAVTITMFTTLVFKGLYEVVTDDGDWTKNDTKNLIYDSVGHGVEYYLGNAIQEGLLSMGVESALVSFPVVALAILVFDKAVVEPVVVRVVGDDVIYTIDDNGNEIVVHRNGVGTDNTSDVLIDRLHWMHDGFYNPKSDSSDIGADVFCSDPDQWVYNVYNRHIVQLVPADDSTNPYETEVHLRELVSKMADFDDVDEACNYWNNTINSDSALSVLFNDNQVYIAPETVWMYLHE